MLKEIHFRTAEQKAAAHEKAHAEKGRMMDLVKYILTVACSHGILEHTHKIDVIRATVITSRCTSMGFNIELLQRSVLAVQSHLRFAHTN
jgi:hypothetical protein